MSKTEEAISRFKDEFNCAQSILGTFSTQFGLDENIALKLASGFGGGMARFGRTCGAVSGAYMVIGLKYGMGKNRNLELKEKTYRIIREFSSRFQDLHGSELCRDLLGCDINTPNGKQHYTQNNFFENKCLQYVKSAAEILDKML